MMRCFFFCLFGFWFSLSGVFVVIIQFYFVLTYIKWLNIISSYVLLSHLIPFDHNNVVIRIFFLS